MLDQNESGLGAVLSPSQATQFLNCPAKWMFRYLLNLKEPGTAATALGTAFHETIAHNYRQKTDTARHLPLAELLCFFREILGQQLEDAVLLDREQPLGLLELGEIMLSKYLDEAAPFIQPAAVETEVRGVIGGVKVYGYVDPLTNLRVQDTVPVDPDGQREAGPRSPRSRGGSDLFIRPPPRAPH